MPRGATPVSFSYKKLIFYYDILLTSAFPHTAMILLNKFLRAAIDYRRKRINENEDVFGFDDWVDDRYHFIYQYKSIKLIKQFEGRALLSEVISKQRRDVQMIYVTYKKYINMGSEAKYEMLYYTDVNRIVFRVNIKLYTNVRIIRDMLAKYTQIWKFVNATRDNPRLLQL